MAERLGCTRKKGEVRGWWEPPARLYSRGFSTLGNRNKSKKAFEARPEDVEDLKAFGYLQELKRSIGPFSSFAISFSLISITTGIFAGFQQGIRQAGPSVIWSWSIVVVGQFLVALVLAEMSRRFPLTGYAYQWTSRLWNPHVGYFVGWLLILQFVTGFPGVCRALADYAHSYMDLGPAISAQVLTVLIMGTLATIHIFGIRLAARLNDAGVIAELVGSILISAVLLGLAGIWRPDAFSFLLTSTNYGTNEPAGIGAWLLSLLMGAWCITGFEAAADLAEETHNPKKTVPRAIVASQLSAGLTGFVMLLAFILAIDNLALIQGDETPLLAIIQSHLGQSLTGWVMLIVFVSIYVCGLASLAAATRVIFSMARDNMLPFSSHLRQVHREKKTPITAIVVVWLLCSLVVLALEQLYLITSISAVAAYSVYGLTIFAFIRNSRSGAEENAPPKSFGWKYVIALTALVWTVFLIGALTIPAVDGGHVPAIATGLGLILGVILYFAVVRRRLIQGIAGPPFVRVDQRGFTRPLQSREENDEG
jgi:amino acid transporter